MHKGVILLVKAQTRGQAETKTVRFLAKYEGHVWDWYVVGGRWTGLLDGYEPSNDPRNYSICSICGGTGYRNDALGKQVRLEDPNYTCNGCGSYDRETGKWGHGKLGPGWALNWNFREHENDMLPLPECIDKVREYLGNWEDERLAEYSKGKDHFKNDKSMQGYLTGMEADVLSDRFSFESNVFDIVKKSNRIPDDPTGYWAVVVDMHN